MEVSYIPGTISAHAGQNRELAIFKRPRSDVVISHWLKHGLVPRPLPRFQVARDEATPTFSMWEWPGDEARMLLRMRNGDIAARTPTFLLSR